MGPGALGPFEVRGFLFNTIVTYYNKASMSTAYFWATRGAHNHSGALAREARLRSTMGK